MAEEVIEEEEGKKEELEDEGAPAAAWLLSYADMMTLIACFFILMMAFANYDPVGFTKKTKEVSKHFNKDKYKSSDMKLSQLQEEVSRHPELKNKSKVSLKDDSLIVSFSGSALFDTGTHTLSEETTMVLDAMIDIIKTKDPNFRILVEGHTDNQAMAEGTTFTSNWALSGARAAAVVERFEYFGFDPQKLIPIGMADTKPLVPNEDDEGNAIPENQKLNRRVVIKVLEPIDKSKEVKMGFGVYFKDATE
ncbi:MAG: flagellar motor protein MotB [Bacteriovoracaceae bacterium]|nr:flagellar motor protein MotB [Bacteriovoracaceae bacterium]